MLTRPNGIQAFTPSTRWHLALASVNAAESFCTANINPNFSSIGGYAAAVGWGVYCSTEFAVEGLTEALGAELTPLGIRATVVEPGFFRTDFLDSSSLISTQAKIADYAETVGKMREFAGGHNNQQPGDPTKLAKAIVALANSADPQLRLPLGTDTLERIAQKNAFVQEETARWQWLAASTDYKPSSERPG